MTKAHTKRKADDNDGGRVYDTNLGIYTLVAAPCAYTQFYVNSTSFLNLSYFGSDIRLSARPGCLSLGFFELPVLCSIIILFCLSKQKKVI